MRQGKRGCFTDCRMCGGRFESLGLAVCPECYELRKGEGGFEDDRRWSSAAGRVVFRRKACRFCGGLIPTHREGRKVQSTVAYCSAAHRQAWKRLGAAGRAEREARLSRLLAKDG